LETTVQVLVDLRDLLDAEPTHTSLPFESLLRNNPDLTLDFIYVLLSNKSTFTKKDIEEAGEECKKKFWNRQNPKKFNQEFSLNWHKNHQYRNYLKVGPINYQKEKIIKINSTYFQIVIGIKHK